ncbi:methylhydroquinone degradation carboxylesterase MhqD [Staphylococcus chromogenes]|uniref:methylhydroquinone degradation carboxylesterase MhqD n=1 Tax=Staphylococcus chromogenes TaxID=46126 RepID=UPI000CD21277|nr:alpha/beta hydrolase [Staphylococcus chromogenes]MBP0046322.1 alpha/beta hydrolase [Staphylococcus chromogenes]MCE5043580.1 alpha/beta hydrolase [Staphylococcus chromogenes]MDY3277360.1 alpha/beta hydrolase [Staphylococcus chromogenes]PNY95072.1 carboxylesterase [Staphylococcus chromogenes]PTF98991.1 carboxylesterase [Staphylococcus chromogenes]
MEHIFKKGAPQKPTFVLLHGTGGDEHDLLPVAELLDSTYNVIAVRGNVSENGMNRFFKRHGEGNYDVEDLKFRTHELHTFLKDAATQYDFDINNTILVGFSNGSNIAIELMLQPEMPYRKGLLFAPLYPLDVDSQLDLSNKDVFLSMGKADPIVTVEQSYDVENLFKTRGANVTSYWVNSHELTRDAIEAAKATL